MVNWVLVYMLIFKKILLPPHGPNQEKRPPPPLHCKWTLSPLRCLGTHTLSPNLGGRWGTYAQSLGIKSNGVSIAKNNDKRELDCIRTES